MENTELRFSNKQYKFINRVTAWIVFLIAFITYYLTIEPTVSFWDCGEFISSSFKLEIGHPPGAPFFMLMAKFFSLFAPDVTHVASMINTLSAFMSALTILFLFWSITHIAMRIIGKEKSLIKSNSIAIFFAAAVGALAYTYSDTFWFSAVEGEVYASSSLFTALVFWAILKWENIADEKYANRWLIFIAYLMGLSIGVHLLNLLAIPAIVFVYYFRKHKISKSGIIKASIAAILILGTIMYIIIPGVIWLASRFELIFVNGMGLPYHSGTVFYFILLFGGLAYGIYYSVQKNKVLLNTILTMITVIIIGYSSYALIIIRSNTNVPMNQNKPDDVFSLLSYLNRDQYGDNPLIYGQYFNSKPIGYIKKTPIYTKEKGKYKIVDYKLSYKFKDDEQTIFPRMWSNRPNHVQGYINWANIKNKDKKPSFAQNIAFFFKYQLNFMYFRYFMWNFAGRQNDIQGHGNVMYGNWISGIPFIDNARLGNQDKLPSFLKNNKGHNKYYLLPLILGILGMFYMYEKNKTGKNFFWVILLFFFFTGIAIVLYLNQPPFQPRERDYAYAASFYAFSIWIGFGVLMLYRWFKKLSTPFISAVLAGLISLIAVPGIMAHENWNDHDRSGRYTARDFAYNYLNSCAPNAILFTNGDNDTFPLWYAQEVEGIRTDVRVVNLSYLNTEWYISQLKHKAYKSEPVPFSLSEQQYVTGKNDIIYIEELKTEAVELYKIIDFIKSDDPRTKLQQYGGEKYIPARKMLLKVDSATIMQNKVIMQQEAPLMLKQMVWDLKGSYLRKAQMMVLDLLSNNNWKRPVYFAITIGSDGYYGLQKFFQLDGLAYRVVPIESSMSLGQIARVNTSILYNNLMHKFKWGGIEKENVYLDENNRRMLMNIKNNFARLANALVKEGKIDSAITVLDKAVKVMPENKIPYSYYDLLIAEAYYQTKLAEKADKIMKIVATNTLEELNYFMSLNNQEQNTMYKDIQRSLMMAQEILRLTQQYKRPELFEELNKKFESIIGINK